MSEAPAELWVTPANLEDEDEEAMAGLYIETSSDALDAVRYVRADLYEAAMALNERVERAYAALLASAQQEPLGELGADYPR